MAFFRCPLEYLWKKQKDPSTQGSSPYYNPGSPMVKHRKRSRMSRGGAWKTILPFSPSSSSPLSKLLLLLHIVGSPPSLPTTNFGTLLWWYMVLSRDQRIQRRRLSSASKSRETLLAMLDEEARRRGLAVRSKFHGTRKKTARGEHTRTATKQRGQSAWLCSEEI